MWSQGTLAWDNWLCLYPSTIYPQQQHWSVTFILGASPSFPCSDLIAHAARMHGTCRWIFIIDDEVSFWQYNVLHYKNKQIVHEAVWFDCWRRSYLTLIQCFSPAELSVAYRGEQSRHRSLALPRSLQECAGLGDPETSAVPLTMPRGLLPQILFLIIGNAVVL